MDRYFQSESSETIHLEMSLPFREYYATGSHFNLKLSIKLHLLKQIANLSLSTTTSRLLVFTGLNLI